MENQPAIIRLTDVSKTYFIGKNQVPVLFDINLQVRQNDFLVIQGPSGSGKSTLLNIIGCIDKPTQGTYTLEDRQVDSLSSTRIAGIRNRKIGFVFQNFNLLPKMTVFNNVQLPLIYSSLGSRVRKKRVQEVLEKVGLWQRKDHHPNEISGGEKQRAAMARALVTRPIIILADEPTGNLDSTTTGEIMELMKQLHEEGNTIVLITHERDVAEYGKTLYFLKDGRLYPDA